MTNYETFRLAAIQAAPVYFDRDASTEKACALILEAGRKGATIAAFGETWLPGYPFYIWNLPSNLDSIAAEYIANAVKIPGETTDQLCEAARQANIDVVIGVAELDRQTQGTVYCTLLFIGNDGRILGRHRKLKPTDEERTVWGEGDGSSLAVYDRHYGRISGLNCWEHNMMLPGYTLIAQGTQIHVAAWPGSSSSRHLFLSRAFASQAAAYVIDVGQILSAEHIATKACKVAYKEIRERVSDRPGESHIIGPRGEIIAGPAEGETILVADGSTEQILAAKSDCDIAGHYSRPDIFQLRVNRTANNGLLMTNKMKSPDGDPGTLSEENRAD